MGMPGSLDWLQVQGVIFSQEAQGCHNLLDGKCLVDNSQVYHADEYLV